MEGLARLDMEIDNVRAAFDRSTAAGDDDTALALAVAVGNCWDVRGRYREGYERIAPLVERGAGTPSRRARALAMLAWLVYRLGDLDAAAGFATRGVEFATASHCPEDVYLCHLVLGVVALDRNDLTTARRHLERAHSIAVDMDHDDARALADGNLADLALTTGDHALARQLWERNLDRSTLHFWVELHTRWGLGTVARREGRHDAADEQFSRCLELAEIVGSPHYAAVALVGLAAVAADRGDDDGATALLRRADVVLEVAGIELTGIDAEAYRDAHRVTLAVREAGARST